MARINLSKAFASLLLLFPILASATYVDLFTYQNYDDPNRVLYAYRGVITVSSTVTEQVLVSICREAAREMQVLAEAEIDPRYQPAALTCFNDGSRDIWLHSSVKNARAGATALRSARVLTESLYNALEWCRANGRGGHGNDGNCGEVGVLNKWMLDTGNSRADSRTSLIVTLHVPQNGGTPYIIPPCGGADERGCIDVLRGVGLGHRRCQITQRGLPSVSRRARIKRSRIARSGAILGKRASKSLGRRGPEDEKKKKAAAGAAAGKTSSSTTKKTAGAAAATEEEKVPALSRKPTFKPAKEAKKAATALKKTPATSPIADKDFDNIWGIGGCDGKPKAGAADKKKAAAGAADKTKKGAAGAADKTKKGAAGAADTTKKGAAAGAADKTPKKDAGKCDPPKKIVNGKCT